MFAKNSKIQNGRHFERDKNILKIWMATLRRYPTVQNFVKIALSSMVFKILAFLCFAIFAKNSKWPPFWARQKIFKHCNGYSAEIPHGSKILLKSLYLARFSRYKHFCVLHFYVLQFLQKIRKFKMARQKFFFKLCQNRPI